VAARRGGVGVGAADGLLHGLKVTLGAGALGLGQAEAGQGLAQAGQLGQDLVGLAVDDDLVAAGDVLVAPGAVYCWPLPVWTGPCTSPKAYSRTAVPSPAAATENRSVTDPSRTSSPSRSSTRSRGSPGRSWRRLTQVPLVEPGSVRTTRLPARSRTAWCRLTS